MVRARFVCGEPGGNVVWNHFGETNAGADENSPLCSRAAAARGALLQHRLGRIDAGEERHLPHVGAKQTRQRIPRRSNATVRGSARRRLVENSAAAEALTASDVKAFHPQI